MTSPNLLDNGELGEPFYPFRHERGQTTAAGWAPWWLPKSEATEPRPGYRPLALDGRLTQQVRLPRGVQVAGLYQQAAVVKGDAYVFSAEGREWPAGAGPAGLQLQIGLDPLGGLDPTSPVVLWSKVVGPAMEWQSLQLAVTAQAAVVTVYLKTIGSPPASEQAAGWRNARLEATGLLRLSRKVVGEGDTYIAVTPEPLRPGEQAAAVVSSQRNYPFVELQVKRPDGKRAAVTFRGIEEAAGRFNWRYLFHAAGRGVYDVRFVGDHGARLLARLLLPVTEGEEKDEVGMMKDEWPDSSFIIHHSSLNIIPRLNYQRVYVLLPPTADAYWLAAAARGSFDGRYTLGFSADDAGLGGWESRQVIAVNPHHWPETLTAGWFQRHYPGTRYTAVVANTPEELEQWLRNITLET
ncbi:MAG: hypothetical protein AB1791_18690 [Chloroflexota bacterium]